MKQLLLTFVAVFTFAVANPAHASIAYGSINNFDTVNDTGHECHGFEIEIDDVHSTDISYTFDWNHYGTPKITEDKSDPLHPKCFIRWESGKNPDGSWAAYTAIPSGPIAPTDGHQFTDPSVNFGGEHFGVGYYGNPTAVKYNWLVDDGTGTLVSGGPVNISTPTFTYIPPVLPGPGLPPLPAQVVAAVVVPQPPAGAALKEFGDAVWVKQIKTTTHNAEKMELRDLVSDGAFNADGKDWRNGEPDEVETEWEIMQTEFAKPDGGANGERQGAPEDLNNGDEVVTRRYEFYKYVGPLDPETNEVMTDAVGPDGIHGKLDYADVVIVGDYIGAQMAGFDAQNQIGLIDHVQPGDYGVEYVARTMVIGGTPPVQTTFTGVIPTGMDFDIVSGVLSGTPQTAGLHQFTLSSTDGTGTTVTKSYDLVINVPAGGEGEGEGQVVVDPLDLVGAYNYLANLLGYTNNDMDGDGICDTEQLTCLQTAIVADAPAGIKAVYLANRAVADGELGPDYIAFIPGLDSLVAAWEMLGMDWWVTSLLWGAVAHDGNLYDVSQNAAVSDLEAACNVPVCGIILPPTHNISTSANPVEGGWTAGDGTYYENDPVSVFASANAGWTFSNWTLNGVVVSSLESYDFTCTADAALVANFTQATYTITTTAAPAEGGTASGGGTALSGELVTVNAVASPGYEFFDWTEGGVEVSIAADYTFVADANRDLVANFSALPPVTRTITTSASPNAGGTSSGGGVYSDGASVTVSAVPSDGYKFVNWTESGVEVSTSADYTFLADADYTLVANFTVITFTVSTGVAPAEGGTATGGGTYDGGTQVTVDATPSAGWAFDSWTVNGISVSNQASYTFACTTDVALVANFTRITYTIGVSASPSAGGSVSGGGVVNSGDSVTVVASAASGYEFSGWSEGGSAVSSSASYTFTASANRDLVANFTRITYTIGVSASPSAGGSVSGGGVVNSGDSVTVVASAASGYTFSNWTEGGVVVSSSASYTFTASANRDLVATFTRITYTVSVSASPVAGGSVSGGGVVNSGDSVTVVASAASGYTFSNWTEGGVVVSSSASYTFTASANRNLVANFALIPPVTYTVSTSAAPAAGGSTSGGGVVVSGSSVTVKATANTGYTFSNWTEGGVVVSTSASYTFTASANRTLVANFTAVSTGATIRSLAFLSPVFGGLPTVGTIVLSAPAPAGGVVVSLSSSSSVLQVPSTIKVPAGSTNVAFAAKTTVVKKSVNVTVTAKTGTSTKSIEVKVLKP